MRIDITSPEEAVGDVLGDVTRRRGKILGQESQKGTATIHTEVPLSEVFGYSTDIRNISKGRASFTMEPSHFERVPTKIQEEITKK
jgi:elongation factor G